MPEMQGVCGAGRQKPPLTGAAGGLRMFQPHVAQGRGNFHEIPSNLDLHSLASYGMFGWRGEMEDHLCWRKSLQLHAAL